MKSSKDKITEYKENVRKKINGALSNTYKKWKFWSFLLNDWIYSRDNKKNENYKKFVKKSCISKEFEEFIPSEREELFCLDDENINGRVKKTLLEIWKEEKDKLIKLDYQFSNFFISLPINLKFEKRTEVYKHIQENFYNKLKEFPFWPNSCFTSSIRFWSQQGELFGARLSFYNFYKYPKISKELVYFFRGYKSYFDWLDKQQFGLTEFICEELLKKCEKPIIILIKRNKNCLVKCKVECKKLNNEEFDLLKFEIPIPLATSSRKSNFSFFPGPNGIIDWNKVTPLWKEDNFEKFLKSKLNLQIRIKTCKKKKCIEDKKSELEKQFKIIRNIKMWEYIYFIPASEYMSRTYKGFGIWFLFSEEPFSLFWIRSLYKLFNSYFLKIGIEDWSADAVKHALRSAVAAIMARNVSHNIGSHVLHYLSNPEELDNLWII